MGKKINVLSVDDDFINLKLVSSILKKNENVNQVFEASNGLEALKVLREHQDIQLILLDMMMPVMNGSKFLDYTTADENFKNIPVIVLTTDESKKYEVSDKGIYDFLVKPIREHILNKKINKLIEDLY